VNELPPSANNGSYLHKGCRLSYEIQGSGPPAIFIQGVGVHGSAWTPQTETLAAHYQCLAFDNRGLGLSQPLGARLAIEQMAEDTLALMDARGWPSAHVVGHSMGGLIALHVALAARDRVRSLSLLCSFPRGRDALRISRQILWTGLRTRIGTKAQRRRAFLEMVLPASALAGADRERLASELAPLFGHDLADQPPVTMNQMAAMARYDATPRLHELGGLPTLVVNAAHDWLATSRVGRAMAAAIPGARFVEIPDASHGASIQHAARINALLMEHFGLS
jgi:pimeloyl-ACP methyl ester carboxylesterase